MTKNLAGFFTPIKAFATLLFALVITAFTMEAAAESSYAEAVGLMRSEQTLGEAGAGLLKTFAKDDMATKVQGIKLYALAQAQFNKLIETLKGRLIKGEDLANSKLFQEALDQAVKKRVAFTEFVDDKVLSLSQEGTKSFAAVLGSADILKSVAELMKVLKDAGLEIWREYRTADKEHRQQIKDQLDSLMWRSYGEVPALE